MNLSLTGVSLPLRFRPATPMTDDELIRFSAANEVLRVERDVNGEIVIMSPAGSQTSRMNSRLTRLLDEWAEQDGRGISFDSNGGFTLPDGSMRAADAAWVLRSRWDALEEADRSRFAPLCPDFVVELRSRTDQLPALERKMEQWIANGSAVAWLIDPPRRTVTTYRAGHPAEFHHGPVSVRGEGIVSGFELVMSRLWD